MVFTILYLTYNILILLLNIKYKYCSEWFKRQVGRVIYRYAQRSSRCSFAKRIHSRSRWILTIFSSRLPNLFATILNNNIIIRTYRSRLQGCGAGFSFWFECQKNKRTSKYAIPLFGDTVKSRGIFDTKRNDIIFYTSLGDMTVWRGFPRDPKRFSIQFSTTKKYTHAFRLKQYR